MSFDTGISFIYYWTVER